ncbi:hypothetical protein CDAR_36611 [Caerostris darwini]|uniref:Uncharacterized protein n=1 Tax=Caerostris darwini TaxID=1538125 RepID=A0AAV4UVN9_9ARAC|nr:hypothetical protein CDAR_36611 [Caerostris darwini]
MLDQKSAASEKIASGLQSVTNSDVLPPPPPISLQSTGDTVCDSINQRQCPFPFFPSLTPPCFEADDILQSRTLNPRNLPSYKDTGKEGSLRNEFTRRRKITAEEMRKPRVGEGGDRSGGRGGRTCYLIEPRSMGRIVAVDSKDGTV